MTENETWYTSGDGEIFDLDVGELLKKEIDRDCISFEVVSEATGIPAKRVERIYSNDLPKEDEMCRILEWVGNR